MKKIGNYTIATNKVLGKGSFATTYQSWSNGQEKIYYACKVTIKKDIQNDRENLDYLIHRVKDQIKSWKQLNHPNIVRFYDWQESKNNLYFFLELCQNGTLQKYINEHQFDKNLLEIIGFTQEIMSAGVYLFNQGIIHRDIKPQNILIKGEHIKLSDFGLARILDPDQSKTNTCTMTFVGTPIYMAPQVLQTQKYTIKCDVWSIGITLYQLLTNQLPFKVKKTDKSPVVILEKIKSQNLDFSAVIFKEIPGFVELISRMLQVDPHKRLLIEQAQKIAGALTIQN